MCAAVEQAGSVGGVGARSRARKYGNVVLSNFRVVFACSRCRGGLKIADLQVYRQQDQSQRFLVVISVAGDAAFPVYNTIASNSDLALFRGMLLTVTLRTPLMSGPSTDAPPKPAEATSNTQSNVLQAFLPKFDITRASVEDAAASEATVAASIRKHADQHVMLVSVKHSGHLATISDTLVSSKSSVASVHCAAAVILLHAHFARVSARCVT